MRVFPQLGLGLATIGLLYSLPEWCSRRECRRLSCADRRACPNQLFALAKHRLCRHQPAYTACHPGRRHARILPDFSLNSLRAWLRSGSLSQHRKTTARPTDWVADLYANWATSKIVQSRTQLWRWRSEWRAQAPPPKRW